MAQDLTPLFLEWPHDPDDDNKNVRCVRGDDGQLKIQVRVRCGIFQWEYDGRPDGARPHGHTSLLDYYLERIQALDRGKKGDASLRLAKEQLEEISEELMDYYQRRVLFFRLGEYERARSDAEHNLRLMDIIHHHVEDAEQILQHEKWRPFVTMDRTRADAMMSCQRGDPLSGIHKIDLGIEEIADFFRRHHREDLIPLSQEIAALKDLKHQLRENYGVPLTRDEVLEGLREEQAKAIAEEDYERAARLRDEISRYEKGEGPVAV